MPIAYLDNSWSFSHIILISIVSRRAEKSNKDLEKSKSDALPLKIASKLKKGKNWNEMRKNLACEIICIALIPFGFNRQCKFCRVDFRFDHLITHVDERLHTQDNEDIKRRQFYSPAFCPLHSALPCQSWKWHVKIPANKFFS